MLSSIWKDHQAKILERKGAQEMLRQDALKASNCLTEALVDHLNAGVAQAYINQKKLDAEAKMLYVNATNFAKQANTWIHLVDSFNASLKDLGDVDAWSKAIESDLKQISSTLEYAYKGSRNSLVSLEARTLDATSFLRKCVIAKWRDLKEELWQELNEQNAGAALILIPRNVSGVDQSRVTQILAMEEFLLRDETQMAVYFSYETPELLEIYSSVKAASSVNQETSALNAIVNAIYSSGYQMQAAASSAKPVPDSQIVSIMGKMPGYGIEDQLPTIVLIAHYDSFGVAPELSFGADSNGSGVAMLLELMRLLSLLGQSSREQPRVNVQFLFSGGGKLNFQGSRRWLEDQLEGLDASSLQDSDFTLCLDTVGGSDELFMHVSKPPKDGSASAEFFNNMKDVAANLYPELSVKQVHKKINLNTDFLAWEHERFSIRRLPAFTVSHLENPRSPWRKSIFDTLDGPGNFDVDKLARNTRVVAEALARHVFKLHPGEYVFAGDRQVEKSSLEAWVKQLARSPRSPQLLAGARSKNQQSVVLSLEEIVGRYTSEVKVIQTKPDSRDPDYVLYDVTKTVITAYSVKPALFDLFLSVGIAAYLGGIYLVIKEEPKRDYDILRYDSSISMTTMNNLKSFVSKIAERGRGSLMSDASEEEDFNDVPKIINSAEGFICPICHLDLGCMENLETHFTTAHTDEGFETVTLEQQLRVEKETVSKLQADICNLQEELNLALAAAHAPTLASPDFQDDTQVLQEAREQISELQESLSCRFAEKTELLAKLEELRISHENNVENLRMELLSSAEKLAVLEEQLEIQKQLNHVSMMEKDSEGQELQEAQEQVLQLRSQLNSQSNDLKKRQEALERMETRVKAFQEEKEKLAEALNQCSVKEKQLLERLSQNEDRFLKADARQERLHKAIENFQSGFKCFVTDVNKKFKTLESSSLLSLHTLEKRLDHINNETYSKLSSRKNLSSELKAVFLELERTKASLCEERESAAEMKNIFIDEQAQLGETIEQKSAKIAELERDISVIQGAHASRHKLIQDDLDSTQNALEEVREELQRMKEQLVDRDRLVDTLREEVEKTAAGKDAVISSQAAQLDESAGKQLELEALLGAEEKEKSAILERYTTIENECITLQSTNSDLVRRLTEVEAGLQELGRENQTLQLELAKLQNRKWADDTGVENCPVCNKLFTLTVRRHHCRQCGGIFCNDCSSKTATLPSSKKPVRRDSFIALIVSDFGGKNKDPSLTIDSDSAEDGYTHKFSNFPESAGDQDRLFGEMPFEDLNFHALVARCRLKMNAFLAEQLIENDGANQAAPSFWSFKYYQQFFDVETDRVKTRLIYSMMPKLGQSYLEYHVRPKPDLYGPFWVCVTLVFCIAISGNISNYLQTASIGKEYVWKYDFHKVSYAATAVFFYVWILPVFLYLAFAWKKSTGITFLEILCLYGYSLFIYIPISVSVYFFLVLVVRKPR
ncbi:unnamed protein product [Notodromas monacha]|uniref:BOS complex subunit NCLN n=1 Tax=Notodromas monacha TaxID=399045 RepID=A0A7R9BTC8_9CRUS|nr:unnamed protein product [Notodromas monacha]CAG0920330.1 unnamed protein product [Notodromas monacha]